MRIGSGIEAGKILPEIPDDRYTAFDIDPSTPAGFLAALRGAELIRGRASFYARLLTPIAKGIQRARGNGRIRPSGERHAPAPR